MMKYSELKELLKAASDAYYKNNNPIMTDREFDEKLEELKQMEEEQGFADDDSPTKVPGSDLTTKNLENSHGRPMLSLENTYNFEEVEKWYNDMKTATGEQNPEVVVNPKWDGGSAAIRYDVNGNVYKALTRGDGSVGENITQNIKYCNTNIWPAKRYNMTFMPFAGEVRGEIIMTTEGFNILNKDGNYQNARNLVSGTMKLLDLNDFIPRAPYIQFYAYWYEDSGCETYFSDLCMLRDNNFSVGDFYLCKNIDEIKEAINKIETTKFPVAIDGAVMKLNKKAYWKTIGSTSKYPRWAKAYKYEQESVETVVTDVTFEIGRSGKITPLCWFEPRFIDGSTIQKATLNNEDFYRNMDVAIGDTVEVQKAAAIIPQIKRVVERPKNRVVKPFPKRCPDCGSLLEKKNVDQNDFYCTNPKCPSRVIDQVINYTHSIECDGFAEVVVERLHQAGLLYSISDLYRLNKHKDEISKLDRLSKNMAEKLCQNIEDTKSTEFWKVLAGLGIPNVGPKMAKVLAKKFKNIDALMNASESDLVAVEDIAEITAKSIKLWFEQNDELIADLKGFGVNLEDKSIVAKTNLEGKIFVITGALSIPRDQYVEKIEACGGKVSGSVSSKTNYLVTNDTTSGSSKNKKAAELGIPVINEAELQKLLK